MKNLRDIDIKNLSVDDAAKKIYECIHGNEEYGRYKDAPIEWIYHKVETTEIRYL